MKDGKYRQIREDAIFVSYALYVLTDKIRKRYHIPPNGSDYVDWLKKHDLARIPEVQKIADLLGLDPLDLQYYIITTKRDLLSSTLLSTPEESNRSRGVYEASKSNLSSGTFIRVTPNSTKIQILDQLVLAKKLLKNTATGEKKHRVQITKLDQTNLGYYQAIESQIIELSSDTKQWQEDYGRYGNKLIKLAIERAVGAILEEKYGDEADFISEVKELKLRILLHDRYYGFIKRYRLPKLREIPHLLSVVGL